MTGRYQIGLLLAVLLVSALLRQGLLFVVCLALLLAVGATALWERYCLTGVEYRRSFSQSRAFFGEEIELTVEIVNRKLLPLAWLLIEDEVPRTLLPQEAAISPSHKTTRRLLVNLLSLRWYERVRRHYRLTCDQRGEFVFGPAHLRSGDLFGFTNRDEERPGETRLLVYPRIVPVSRLGLPAHDPFGERAVRRWLYTDPSRVIGVRDYQPGDSLRRIHWAATARTQALQVKLDEPTITYRLTVLLNLNTVAEAWWWPGYQPELLELAIMTAASVANWAVEQGYQVGLIANGAIRLSEEPIRLAPSRDPDQLTQILSLLARVTPVAVAPLAEVLRQTAARLPFGSTLAVVSAVLDDVIIGELLALRRRGHAVALLLIGEHPVAAGADPLPIFRIGGLQTWRELTTI